MEVNLTNELNEGILEFFFNNPKVSYLTINDIKYFNIYDICNLLNITKEEFETIRDEVSADFQLMEICIPSGYNGIQHELVLYIVDEAGYYFIISKFPNIPEAKKLVEYANMVRDNIIEHQGIFIHPDILSKFSEENEELAEWLKDHPQDANNLVLPE